MRIALLATQSETHVRTVSSIVNVEDVVNVESTVVIAGSSRRLPVFVEEVTGVSWGSTGTGPVAYTLSQPVAVPDRRTGVTRPVAAFLAGVGLLIGLDLRASPRRQSRRGRSRRAYR